jgi:K(+)-stimulated pyrophosphate-energized sodium pump
MNLYYLVLLCGVVALLYGAWAVRSVLAAPAGNKRMQEIASAIQEGAGAYLNRQYSAIAIVGVIIGILLGFWLGMLSAIGYVIGAVLSGLAGYIGMHVSVRANVRTTEAARSVGLAGGLDVAFKSGAVTGMLVVGLALIGVAGYYVILRNIIDANSAEGMRQILEAMVALGFGASLISILLVWVVVSLPKVQTLVLIWLVKSKLVSRKMTPVTQALLLITLAITLVIVPVWLLIYLKLMLLQSLQPCF